MLPDRFDAETARGLGLVNWVVPTTSWSRRPTGSPAGWPMGRRALMRKPSGWSINPSIRRNAQMEDELQAFSRCARGADLKEGVTAFVEKRKPVFKGS